MKYAIVENIKTEATKGARGICPCCGAELIAKCGSFRINHWAHRGNRKCDNWWENETEWHRSWKDNFNSDWQEIPMLDEKTHEKHIADVYTIHDLVIEFQHSPIAQQERMNREKFYKNMVWVVNGARRKRDYPRFIKGRYRLHPTEIKGIFSTNTPEEYFPSDWLLSSVPVIFDFRSVKSNDDFEDVRSKLYCLFPNRIGISAIIAEISFRAFLKAVINGKWALKVMEFTNKINQANFKMQKQNVINNELMLLQRMILDIANSRSKRNYKRRRHF